MFRGRYEHSVDAKGRIAFPADLREELKRRYDHERLVLTKHLKDPCLLVYPLREWEEFEAKVARLPQFDASGELLRRWFIGPARDVDLDPQGRILVPQEQRNDIALERDAVWLGVGRIIELWSRDNHVSCVESKRSSIDPGELERLLKKAAELGL
ncbi:MAG: division/cell wall cluster transcriptional repressor MraZ [Deltaproteobacteria bacterium]|nr:division/cell wall cluster transcriptional repressor MraZ [Deltaproteobacteria bacterium]